MVSTQSSQCSVLNEFSQFTRRPGEANQSIWLLFFSHLIRHWNTVTNSTPCVDTAFITHTNPCGTPCCGMGLSSECSRAPSLGVAWGPHIYRTRRGLEFLGPPRCEARGSPSRQLPSVGLRTWAPPTDTLLTELKTRIRVFFKWAKGNVFIKDTDKKCICPKSSVYRWRWAEETKQEPRQRQACHCPFWSLRVDPQSDKPAAVAERAKLFPGLLHYISHGIRLLPFLSSPCITSKIIHCILECAQNADPHNSQNSSLWKKIKTDWDYVNEFGFMV